MIDHVLVHIGGPKSLSTSLQRSFFLKHSQINFAGIGYENNSYCNPQIELIFESLLKYATRTFWLKHLERSQKAVSDFINPEMLNVFSSEHLGFSFSTTQLDLHEKLDRLLLLFGDSVPILFVLRNQVDLLKSLYKEFLKMGATISYSEYIEYIYNFQDRNFYFEFLYHDLFNLLKSKGFTSLHILVFEELIDHTNFDLNSYFRDKFQLNNENVKLSKENPSMTDPDCFKLLNINKAIIREMGAGHFNAFEMHRSKVLFDFLDSNYKENEIYKDVLLKRKAISQLEKIQIKDDDFFKLSPRADLLLNRMLENFRDSNSELEKDLHLELPVKYHF